MPFEPTLFGFAVLERTAGNGGNMEGAAAPPPQAGGSLRARLGELAQSIWRFITSPAGLTAVVSLFGLLASGVIAQINNAMNLKQHVQTDHAAAIGTLRELIDTTIAERALSASALAAALVRPAARAEVQANWTVFQKASHDYDLQNWKNRINIEYDTAGKRDSNPAFAVYLNAVINPAFERAQSCLTEAHDAYLAKSAGGNDTAAADGDADAAGRVLAACEMDHLMPALQTCARDFTYEFDWSARLAAQVLQQNETAFSAFGGRIDYVFRELTQSDAAACATNAECRQEKFFANIRRQLALDCGPIPKKKPVVTLGGKFG